MVNESLDIQKSHTSVPLYKDSYICDIMMTMGSHEVEAQEVMLAGNRNGVAGGRE